MTAAPNLRVITGSGAKPAKGKKRLPPKRESASDIAARLRKGKPPKRPMVVRQVVRPANGEEVWI